MKPTVIGLDLDGVVADYTAAFAAHYARSRGLRAEDLPEPISWNFSENNWGIATHEDYYAAHSAAVRDGMFATMAPIPGAVATLRGLGDDFHIRIITHRLVLPRHHQQTVADTVTWLDAVGVPYRDVCFISDKATVDADVYIDDAPHNITSLSGAGKKVIIFDQPYNRLPHLDDLGVRVRTWEEVGEELYRIRPAT